MLKPVEPIVKFDFRSVDGRRPDYDFNVFLIGGERSSLASIRVESVHGHSKGQALRATRALGFEQGKAEPAPSALEAFLIFFRRKFTDHFVKKRPRLIGEVATWSWLSGKSE
jgi:hypothetical protein